MPEQTRFAWAKLNAYGFILAGLALLSLADLYRPASSSLARALGEVPPGQDFWATGNTVAGLLLLYGLARSDRAAESVALLLLFSGLVAQTVVTLSLLGWTDFTFSRFALVAIVGLGGAARASALWSRNGLVITIPARRQKR